MREKGTATPSSPPLMSCSSELRGGKQRRRPSPPSCPAPLTSEGATPSSPHKLTGEGHEGGGDGTAVLPP